MASFLFRNTRPEIEQLIEAVSVYNIAAELAENKTMSMALIILPELLDQMYQIDETTFEKYVHKVEV